MTTIAWRLGHLGGMAVAGLANRRLGDGTLTTEQLDFPPHASGAPAFLAGHYRTWRTALVGPSPSQWVAPLGPSWGP